MKKIIVIILMSLITVSLGSCKEATPTSITYQPIYNYTDVEKEPTSLEDTVADIYDSVVSINTYVNNKLYGSGSGIIISSDKSLNLSYILTCYHVIENGTAFRTIINNKDGLVEAKLVGGDKKSDVALLSIKGLDYTYATINKSNDLRLASTVIAIGNPLGTLPGSVSIGHVSYLRREVMSSDYNTMELIQTDTAINSGNSGGGLFDSNGNLVGIVNAKFAKAGVEGLGFAIPMDTAFKVIEDVFKTAVYNTNTNEWKKGYLLGSWELGFKVADLVAFPYQYLGIAEASTNPNTSGYNQFKKGDQIIEASYKKGNTTEALDITSSSAFYLSLYKADLKLGDSIFIRTGYGTIEVKLVQFIPE